MNRCRITPNDNGSLHIEGEFELVDPSGQTFDLGGRTEIWLCRCGQSQDKPFCDGSHKRVGFVSQIKAKTLPSKKA